MIVRTVGAVERADVVVMVIDAQEGVTEQDAKIAGIAHERGKAVIIAVNKWDAVEKDRPGSYSQYIWYRKNASVLYRLQRSQRWAVLRLPA